MLRRALINIFTIQGSGQLLYPRKSCSAHAYASAACFQDASGKWTAQGERPEVVTDKKILKVAIIGRPNAGKSTLINQMLKMNVCDVSSKTHTTRIPVRAALTFGNTQLVFVDTPGLVTDKEISRFKLTRSFFKWKQFVLNDVDIIGVIDDVSRLRFASNFHVILMNNLKNVAGTKPMFLILNKVDKIGKKEEPSARAEQTAILNKSDDDGNEKTHIRGMLATIFSDVFYTSALKNIGVQNVVDYLIKKAKVGEWLLKEGQIFDVSLDVLIVNMLRAKLLNLLPEEIPYVCRYEVEFLEENDLGEIICVALITCKNLRHQRMIISKKKKSLRILCQEIETDLYNILKKVVRLRVVARTVLVKRAPPRLKTR